MSLYIISGGGLFGILGNYTNRWGRDPVVLLGMLTHFTSFLLIFYNLPDAAIHGHVDYAYGQLFKPSRYILDVLLWFCFVRCVNIFYSIVSLRVSKW